MDVVRGGKVAIAEQSRRNQIANLFILKLLGPRPREHLLAIDQRDFQAQRGAPEVLVYNAGSGVWKTAEELTPSEFELSFKINALGLLSAAQQVLPAMRERGQGQIVVVGATASLRGRPKTAAFAAAKAAQRSLAQSLARQCAPEGIHVGLLIIDGSIDVAGAAADSAVAKRLRPEDIADEAFHLVRQDRSAWTFELDLRPMHESW